MQIEILRGKFFKLNKHCYILAAIVVDMKD